MATYIHGKNAKFFMDNAAGSLTEFSDIITDASINLSVATGDTSHLGSNSKTYITGQNDGTSSVTGLFDRTRLGTITTLFAALMAGTVVSSTVEMAPEGNASGATKISQEMILTSLKVGSSVGNVVSVSFDLQRTGDTTFGTYA